MSKYLLWVTIVLVCCLTPVTLFASEVGESEESVTETDVDIHAVPPILDPEYRHRKRHQFEFSPYGASYLGSTLGQTWMAGPRLYYHLNNTWAIGANYGYSRLMTDRNTTFGRSMTNNNMHVVTAEVMISNDAAFRSGKSVCEMDFYLTLGAGAMWINGDWEPVGEIGGGVKFYTGIPWLAFRVDVNNYAHYTSKPGKDPFDFDVVFAGGVSFLFPTHPSPYEMKESSR